MTLQQLAQIKCWLRLHGGRHPVELQAWDLVLTCWVLGWVSVPGLMLLEAWPGLPLSLLAFLLPTLYAGTRRRLHRQGRLRCDWLTAL
jgi:hypothetical protein